MVVTKSVTKASKQGIRKQSTTTELFKDSIPENSISSIKFVDHGQSSLRVDDGPGRVGGLDIIMERTARVLQTYKNKVSTLEM